MENIPKNVEYIKPKDSNIDPSERAHRFEIRKGEEVISEAKVVYRTKPIPFYEISQLFTHQDNRKQGYASLILNEIEQFALSKKRPCVLLDFIEDCENSSPGLYDKRPEWRRPWPDDDILIFNWPQNIPINRIKEYDARGSVD